MQHRAVQDDAETHRNPVVPDNERKACDAVARILEGRYAEVRSNERCPERDGRGPPVDYWFNIGGQTFAVEHTRIEAFPEQIRTGVDFSAFVEPIERALDKNMPSPGSYSLIFRIDPTDGISRKRLPALRQSIIEWAHRAAAELHAESPVRMDRYHKPHGSDNTRVVEIDGVEVRLRRQVHWAENGSFDGRLHVMRVAPDAVEDQRRTRIQTALDAKCPKLLECKNLGARSILLLENVDIALTNHAYVAETLELLLAGRRDTPDEILYLDTTGHWTIWSIVNDGRFWPDEDQLPPYHDFDSGNLTEV